MKSGAPPIESEWPEEGLESVDRCPVCGAAERRRLLSDLRDTTFCSAPGSWVMWRCAGCESGFLDPRPTEASIIAAYRDYYTHASATERAARRCWFGARFHTLEGVYGRRGALLALLARRIWPQPSRQARLEYAARFLPAAVTQSNTLLDLGCGAGTFLRHAAKLGWNGFGCDFDPQAVSEAQSLGLDVRLGGAGSFSDRAGSFDVVTVNHVIEHVHKPGDLLKDAFDLLRPGGQLYVETPNVASLGLSLYGKHWRGLEPPRHLVLFNWRSLTDELRAAGFGNIVKRPQFHVAYHLWAMSDRISAGKRPDDGTSKPTLDFIRTLPKLRSIGADNTEFVTVTAMKSL